MRFPDILQNGSSMPFPAWAKFLAKVGHHMAINNAVGAKSPPRLAIVCLPRIDYAALFTAYGVLCSLCSDDDSIPDSKSVNLDGLLNKKVSCLKVKGSEAHVLIGILESVDYTSGVATILTQNGSSYRFIYHISRKDWYLIRGTDVLFDITRGATERQRLRASDAYREYHEIAKVMGVALASAATRTSSSYATIVGEKSRFIEEIESLTFKHGEPSLAAGILLNSENETGKNSRNSGRCIDLHASGRSLTEAKAPLVIVEAGRGLGDQLQQLDDNKRAIILVAANKRSHNDVVELLAPLINFRGLCEPTPDLGAAPQYLKTIFIR